jgi:hypothetical protein
MTTYNRYRRLLATTHAGGWNDAHTSAKTLAQRFEEFAAPGELTRKRITHPHNDRWRRRVTVL